MRRTMAMAKARVFGHKRQLKAEKALYETLRTFRQQDEHALWVTLWQKKPEQTEIQTCRARMLSLVAGVCALLPLDDESYMQQTRAERAEKLRAARQNAVGSQFSVANPQTTWYLWPEETSCRGVAGEFNHYRLDRLGKLGPDASKWVCNSRALAAQQPRCLVYAFGGHAEFDWDIAMTQHTGCEHHIFDPTAPCHEPGKQDQSCKPWAALLGPKLIAESNVTSYQPYGISGHDGTVRWFKESVPVYSLSTIMAKLGHTGRRIDVLKMDIEGSEFDVVPNLVKSGIEIGQLLIEVHWPLHRAEFSRKPAHMQTSALHAHFFGALEKAGFAVAHVEFNIACGFTCVEFLWVNRRLFPLVPVQQV